MAGFRVTVCLSVMCIQLLAPVSSSVRSDPRRVEGSSLSNRVNRPETFDHAAFWSSWAEWQQCTQTCGGGISTRLRYCQPRQRVRSDSCPGDSKQYRLCNTQSCPPDGLDFRQRQCAAYNNKYIAGGYTRRWMPANGHHGCELKCRSADHGSVYTFGKANDSTPCSKNGKQVCLNGRCMEVGCDLLLGSTRQLDVCGVCGGRNDTCKQVQNNYIIGSHQERRKIHDKGYEEVAFIPAGSTRIRVTDTSEKNFLALADSSMRFLVNGGRDISWPGSYPLAGTHLNYSRQWQAETFYIAGPTQQDLHLMLLVYDKYGAPVSYDYWTPVRPSSVDERQNRLPEPDRGQQPSRPRPPSTHRDTPKEEIPKEPNNRLFPGPSSTRQPYPQRPEPPREGPARNPEDYKRNGDPYGNRDPRYPNPGKPDRPGQPSIANDPRYHPDTHGDGQRREEDKKGKKDKKDRRKDDRRAGKGRRNPNQGRCPRCKRINEKVRNFCESDFVVRARVLDLETVGSETRYDLGIVESYKNTVYMSHREYVWSPAVEGDPTGYCRCPRLRKNQDYLLMGRFDRNYRRRESRLLLNSESFVRKANPQRDLDMKNLKKLSPRKCKRE